MSLSKQAINFDLFFARPRYNINDICYTSQSSFRLPKNTICNCSKKINFCEHLPRHIILPFQDMARLDKNLQECKQLCRRTWENEYDYSKLNRFAKSGEGNLTK